MDNETKEVITRAELPKIFREIRLALGLSQEKMSELSGISRVQISYYETADSVPTMVTFNKWLLAVTKEIRRHRENKWGKNAVKKSGWGVYNTRLPQKGIESEAPAMPTSSPRMAQKSTQNGKEG